MKTLCILQLLDLVLVAEGKLISYTLNCLNRQSLHVILRSKPPGDVTENG